MGINHIKSGSDKNYKNVFCCFSVGFWGRVLRFFVAFCFFVWFFFFPLVDWVLKNGKSSLEQNCGQDRAQNSQKGISGDLGLSILLRSYIRLTNMTAPLLQDKSLPQFPVGDERYQWWPSTHQEPCKGQLQNNLPLIKSELGANFLKGSTS